MQNKFKKKLTINKKSVKVYLKEAAKGIPKEILERIPKRYSKQNSKDFPHKMQGISHKLKESR